MSASFQPRTVFAYSLHQQMQDDYRVAAGTAMPVLVGGRFRQGSQYVCCDYASSTDENDVFKRVASLGYFWVSAAGARTPVCASGLNGLIECLVRMLAHEGAQPVPPSHDWPKLRTDISTALTSCWKKPGTTDDVALQTFKTLEHLLAKGCVCADGNQKPTSPHKACHA